MPIFDQQFVFVVDMPLDPATDLAVSDPAFEAGDWQISYDFNANDPDAATWTDASTLPVVLGDGGTDRVRLTLTAAEIGTNAAMHARLIDATDPEAWLDTLFELQNEAAGSGGGTIAVPIQPITSTLTIFRGDRYNGTDAAKLTWDTTKSYSNQTCSLVIFSNTNMPLLTGTGTAHGNTVTIEDIEIELAESLFTGNPLSAKLTYAVTVGTKETIAYGRCLVRFRPDND